MEAATVARRPAAVAAAAPAAAPPRAPTKRPRSRPAPGKRTAPSRRKAPKAGAAAPARTAPKRRSSPAPKRRSAAPARTAPKRRTAPARPHTGQLIPIALGTAARVKQLPDSSLVVRMTRGRAWIGVLGVLLVGIVALNVFTLSIAAGAGHIDENIQALEKDNSITATRAAAVSGAGRVRHEAAGLGLAMADVDEQVVVEAGSDDAAVAAERLAGAG